MKALRIKLVQIKAIIGKNAAKTAFGGLQIYAQDASSGKNIIIQNITFSDAHSSTEYDASASGAHYGTAALKK